MATSALSPAQPMLVNASRFRAAHAAEWERLERLVSRIEKRSIRALNDDDLLALPLLYRSALSSINTPCRAATSPTIFLSKRPSNP